MPRGTKSQLPTIVQIGYSRTKLNTLVSFPIRGLNMASYLAPRSNQRPASATLQRRVQLSTTRAKTFASHSKSVRFEDAKSSSKHFNRSMSTKESKFHFPWKKRKEEDRSNKCSDAAAFTASVCDSPSSVRSAPSGTGNAVNRGKRVYSPVHSVDGTDMRCRSPTSSDGSPNSDQMYDLYAVCNHMGTMTRGHYTAFCRNPADGHWYVFDDNHVQSIPEEQLVTAGAYLLFYVRQSLLNQLPPLSSTSSSSSSSGCSSNHWAMHIPRFRLDLTGSFSSPESPYSPNININEVKASRRLGSSSASAVSAPPYSNTRGFFPHCSAPDNESDVFVQSRDNHSAVSVPTSSTNTPLHHHQLSSPAYHGQSSNQVRAISNVRHASLRVSRPTEPSPDHNAQFMRRGTSFHGQHQAVQRSLTDSGRVLEMPAHPAYPSSGQGLAMPSRSIPNMAASADYSSVNPQHPFPLPSRSIPDMPAHLSPPPVRHHFPQDPNLHFMTPQPHRARTYSASQGYGKTESCV